MDFPQKRNTHAESSAWDVRGRIARGPQGTLGGRIVFTRNPLGGGGKRMRRHPAPEKALADQDLIPPRNAIATQREQGSAREKQRGEEHGSSRLRLLLPETSWCPSEKGHTFSRVGRSLRGIPMPHGDERFSHARRAHPRERGKAERGAGPVCLEESSKKTAPAQGGL